MIIKNISFIKILVHCKSIYISLQKSAQKNKSGLIEVWNNSNRNGGGAVRSFKMKMGKILASLALMVTAYNINAACIFLVHQPKIPKGAEKLRKF